MAGLRTRARESARGPRAGADRFKAGEIALEVGAAAVLGLPAEPVRAWVGRSADEDGSARELRACTLTACGGAPPPLPPPIASAIEVVDERGYLVTRDEWLSHRTT
ncbi:MAG: hypothetical protein IPK80_19310 [Nannocystis sp.]|nr:hypothetical protein [Nannocystis sp.]